MFQTQSVQCPWPALLWPGVNLLGMLNHNLGVSSHNDLPTWVLSVGGSSYCHADSLSDICRDIRGTSR